MKRTLVGCLAAVLFLLLGSSTGLAQTGTLVGTVVDGDFGDGIIGANVSIAGTQLGAVTDLDGGYRISNIPVGTYDVVFSYVGFGTQRVTGVEIGEGETERLDVTLGEDAQLLGEIVVEARLIRNNDAALLADRQRAAGVSDAISAEAISRSGAGDAAAAMGKVTGASVVGGKYVFVRGLGDRYSTTQLNGAPLPSADPDRQAFQLDLLPSNLLDNIVTLKTFTPDKPGNFTGGLVNVGTKDFPDELTFRVSYSGGFTSGVTGETIGAAPSSGTDWLGFDDGMRDVPDMIENLPRDPETNEVIIPRVPSRGDYRDNRDSSIAVANQIDAISNAFSPVYTPQLRTAPVNQSFSVSFGNLYPFGGERQLGVTASLSYGRSASARQDPVRGQYELRGLIGEAGGLQPLLQLGGPFGSADVASIESSIGGLATLAYRFSGNHSASFTYLQTQSGVNSARQYSGFSQEFISPDPVLNNLYETRVLSYQERSVRSGQLSGTSAFGDAELEWNLSAARNTQEDPDLRYFTSDVGYARDASGRIDTTFQINAPRNYVPPTRFFRDLQEDTGTAQVNLTIPFRLFGQGHRFKTGGYYQDIAREFNQRRFEFDTPGGVFDLFGGNPDSLFAGGVGFVDLDRDGLPDTSRTGARLFGLTIDEVTPLREIYVGDQSIAAGYVMLDLALTERLRFIGGARVETTDITLTSADSSANFGFVVDELGAQVIGPDGTPLTERTGVLDNVDVLPSANLVYALTDNMNARLAATRTLARPTFRELAPFASFEFIGDFVYIGNPNLRRTQVANLDARWEWFFAPGQIVAVSGFYKRFTDPIERVIRSVSVNGIVTSDNVDEARVYGAELELRKGFGTFAAALEPFSFGANLALIQSVVDIPDDELDEIRAADPNADDTRPFNGQSPYVVNLDLSYERGGTSAGLFFNQVGDRLLTVTRGATPDVYEEARPDLDFSFSQQLPRGLRLSFRAGNLLDAEYREVQTLDDQDFVFQSYRTGRTFSLGVSYGI